MLGPTNQLLGATDMKYSVHYSKGPKDGVWEHGNTKEDGIADPASSPEAKITFDRDDFLREIHGLAKKV